MNADKRCDSCIVLYLGLTNYAARLCLSAFICGFESVPKENEPRRESRLAFLSALRITE